MRLRLWICLLSWLVPTGCEQGAPCDDVNCGLYGVCDRGACVCDPGYQPTADGLGCVPFEHEVCEGITCSGLGHCEPGPGGPRGTLRPVCVCDPGAVPTTDDLDCVDPCDGIDCAPGTCQAGDDGTPACVCPDGYLTESDPPGCHEQTLFTYEIVFDPAGQAYPMGTAWLQRRRTAESLTLESAARYLLPNAEQGGQGGTLRTTARYDQYGRLVEISQDHQPVFGTVTARRRLHYTAVEEHDGTTEVLFESSLLDRLWRGSLQAEGGLPPPMADGYEYPAFQFGCFDPLFYVALRRRIDPLGPPPGTITVLVPGFALPNPVEIEVAGDEATCTIRLPDYELEADFEGTRLAEVRYAEWGLMRRVPGGGALELSFLPLPHTPVEHEPETFLAPDEAQIVFASSDGTSLEGSLALPEGEPLPVAVLFVPGLYPTNRDKSFLLAAPYRKLSARLADAGFASLRFDGRGTGRSGGQSAADPARLEEDLDAAFAVLDEDPRFEKVVLAGHGFASLRALEAARRLGPAGLILLAPAGDDLAAATFHRTGKAMEVGGIHRDWIDAYRQYHQDDMDALQNGSYPGPYAGRSVAFWQDWLGRDLLDAAGLAMAALVLHGEEDIVLPANGSDQVADALAAGGCTVTRQILPGLSHQFAPGAIDDLWESVHLPWNIDPDVVDTVLAWLEEL